MAKYNGYIIFLGFFFANLAYGQYLANKKHKLKEQNEKKEQQIISTAERNTMKMCIIHTYNIIIQIMKNIKSHNEFVSMFSEDIILLNKADKTNFMIINNYTKKMKNRLYYERSNMNRFINKYEFFIDDKLEKFIYFQKMKYLYIIRHLDNYQCKNFQCENYQCVNYQHDNYKKCKKIKHDDNINYSEQCINLKSMIYRLNKFMKNRNKIDKYFDEKMENFDVNIKAFETIQKMCDRNKIKICDILYYNDMCNTISKNTDIYFCAVTHTKKCRLILSSICLYLVEKDNDPQFYYFYNHKTYMEHMFYLCQPLIKMCYNKKWNVVSLFDDIFGYKNLSIGSIIEKIHKIMDFANDKEDNDIMKLIKYIYIFKLILHMLEMHRC